MRLPLMSAKLKMYKIVYAKQALKDIKNLKAVRLDFKAKALIEIIMKLNLCLHADNLCTAFAVDAQALNVGRFEWSFREVA